MVMSLKSLLTPNLTKGNNPGAKNPVKSIIRLIDYVDPVVSAKNSSLTCGPGAKPAVEVAEAKPGSKLTFKWSWIHNTGPMLTYLASCGNLSCSQFDSSQAKWFKIDQQGHKSGSIYWVQRDVMNGQPVSVMLPKTLAAGNYLIRHEIIALHDADKPLRAEFYPSCAQLSVSGDQTGIPLETELVSFPGAYSDDDPGILCKNDIQFSTEKYPFPGPKIAAFVSNGAKVALASAPTAASSSSQPSSASPSTIIVTTTATTTILTTAAAESSGESCSHSNTIAKLRRKGGASMSTPMSSTALSTSQSSSGATTPTGTPEAQARRRSASRLFRWV
ncbi:hypothetical protein DXG01_007384 [Tephrocybe rancida]|nr:hypothetical protein DXG01_007384 [Tephrocybe rancida]